MAENELKVGVAISGLPKAESDLKQLAQAETSAGTAGEKAGDAAGRGHEKAATKADEHQTAEKELGREAEKAGNKAEQAGKKSGKGHEEGKRKAKDHGDKVVTLQDAYSKAEGALQGFVGSYAGFAMLQKALDQYLQSLEKVRDAMRTIAEQSGQTDASIHDVAVQLGDVTPEGMRKAGQMVRELGTAGGFDIGTAQQFAISADVALEGTLKENMEIAKEIAAIAGAKNLKADEAGKLIELLKTAGALENPEKTKEAIAKISAAATAAKSTSFGAFATMIQAGGTAMLTQKGTTLDDVLNLGVQMRGASTNEAIAATGMLQFTRSALGTSSETLKFLQGKARAKGMNFAYLSMMEKANLLKQLFMEAKTPEQMMELQQAIPGEVYTTLLSAFSEGNLATTASAKGKIAGATAGMMDETVAGFRRTDLYRERAADIERQFRMSENAAMERTYKRLEQDAQAEYTRAKGQNELRFWEGDESVKERFMVERMKRDVSLRKEQARTGGDESAVKRLERVEHILERMQQVPVTGVKYGYADQIMDFAVKDYGEAMKITVNNYYGQQGGTQIVQGGKGNPRTSPGSNPIGAGDSVLQTGQGATR